METVYFIYFSGVAAIVALLTCGYVINLVFSFFNGTIGYDKNLKKIGIYSSYILGRSLLEKPAFLKVLSAILVTASLSWISVLLELYRNLKLIFFNIRNILGFIPSDVKSIRFPLIMNMSLAREEVWARQAVLAIKIMGVRPSLEELAEDLELVKDRIEPREIDSHKAFSILYELSKEFNINISGLEEKLAA